MNAVQRRVFLLINNAVAWLLLVTNFTSFHASHRNGRVYISIRKTVSIAGIVNEEEVEASEIPFTPPPAVHRARR